MAIVGSFQTKDEADKDKEQQAPPTLGGPQQGSITAQASPQGAPAQDKRNVSSGRFTNVQKYLQANQGGVNTLSQQAQQRMGQQFDRNVKQQQSAVGQVGSGIGQAESALGQGQQFQQQVGDKAFDPTAIAGDQNKLGQFTQFRTGQAVDEAALQKQQQEASMKNVQGQQQAQQTIQGTKTEQGRSQMLRDLTPKTQYNLGQQRLDQLFLQRDKNALGNIRSTVGEREQQMKGLGQTIAGQQSKIGDITTREADIQKGINEQLGMRRQEMAKDVQDRFEAEKNKAQSDLNALQAGLAKGELTQQQYDTMSNIIMQNASHLLSADGRGGRLYGMDLSQLASAFSNPEFDISKFASQQDIARRDALASLSGIQDADTILNLDEQMAGQYRGPFQMNVDQANELFRNAERAYLENVNPYAGAAAQASQALSSVNTRNQQLNTKANELAGLLEQINNPNLGLSDRQALAGQAENLRQQLLTDYSSLYSGDTGNYFNEWTPATGTTGNYADQRYSSTLYNQAAPPQLQGLLSAITNYQGTGGDLATTNFVDQGFTNLVNPGDAANRAQALRSLLGSQTGLTGFDEYLQQRSQQATKEYEDATSRFGGNRTLASLIKKG